MADTVFNGDAISRLGGELQSLMNDYTQHFNALISRRPNAGKFSTAEWLEEIIGDRRDAVVQHGFRFNMTVDEFGSTLKQIGTDFPDADGENARKIVDVLEQGRARNQGEVNDYSEATEAEWQNYGDQADGTDGNGWDNSMSLSANDKNEDDDSGDDSGDDSDSDDSDSDDSDSDDSDSDDSDSDDSGGGRRNATGGGSPFDA